MAALTANSRRKTKASAGGVLSESLSVKTNQVIYEGSLVAIVLSTGRLTVADNVATVNNAVGVALEKVTGTTGGTVKCRFQWGHMELFDSATALTAKYLGSDVCCVDDNLVSTASAAGTAALQCKVGQLMELPSANKAWVWVGHFAGSTI